MNPQPPGRRRDHLKALLGDLGAHASPPAEAAPAVARPRSEDAPQPDALTDVTSTVSDVEAPKGRAVSGSVRAMRLSLGEMGAKAAEAQALRAAIEAGETAIDLDPALLDPSFVLDRLAREGDDDPDFRAFVEDMRVHGQLTPILVRPHPERAGRWQIAFGHRRWRAAALIGRPVKALIRPLDDAALVVAQGQENAQRRDLSFIEKALFARALEERGFARAVVVAALAVHPSEAARLIGVARELPADLAGRIGPAPKAGRPRWMALALALKADGAVERARAALDAPDASALDSDARFARALAAAQPPVVDPRASEGETLVSAADGAALARMVRKSGATRFEIDARRAPDLVRKIEALLRREAIRRGGAEEDA